jgi:signal peptidase I
MPNRSEIKQTSPSLGSLTRMLVILGCVSLMAAIGLWLRFREQTREYRQAIIAGNSMAPHFWGEHLAFTCPDCACPFETSTEVPRSQFVVCPNCGFREIPVASGERRDAERFYIKPLEGVPLNRWDVVAIAEPEPSQPDNVPPRFFIKRIVGLPGERIAMADGEILVNEKLLALNWADIDDQKILVFDSAFEPKSKPRERIVVTPAEVWQTLSEGWHCNPVCDSSNPEGQDELPTWAYQSWRCYRHAGDRDELGPVDDFYSFDQSISRNVHAMDSLVTTIEVLVEGDSEFVIHREYLGSKLKFVLSWQQKEVRVLRENGDRNSQMIQTFPLPAIDGAKRFTIDVATITGRVGIRIQGVLEEWISWEKQSAAPSEKVIQIHVLYGSVGVQRLRIWRSIYWFDQLPGMRVPAVESRVFEVPDGHYFVMGDNVPVSKDSRDWDSPYVLLERIAGRVTRVSKPE